MSWPFGKEDVIGDIFRISARNGQRSCYVILRLPNDVVRSVFLTATQPRFTALAVFVVLHVHHMNPQCTVLGMWRVVSADVWTCKDIS